MYQSAAPKCRSHLRLTVAACQWPIYLSQLSTPREKVSSRTQWESSLNNISKHLCCRVRRQTSRYATVRLHSLLSCDVCCGRFSRSAYTWGNSRKHFFTSSARRSGAPEEPLQRRCSEMCFFLVKRAIIIVRCAIGDNTRSTWGAATYILGLPSPVFCCLVVSVCFYIQRSATPRGSSPPARRLLWRWPAPCLPAGAWSRLWATAAPCTLAPAGALHEEPAQIDLNGEKRQAWKLCIEWEDIRTLFCAAF